MLELLKFKNVGPAPELSIEFKPRMNILVGDNGLGKTFLLDTAWWALTRTWAAEKAMPFRPPARASIKYQYGAAKRRHSPKPIEFDRSSEEWKLPRGRPPIPGLVLYARVDGGFAAWDPARNYWKGEDKDRQSAYIFQPSDVWDGLPAGSSVKFCNGLIADWANWQLEGGEAFQQLKAVLSALSPTREEQIKPGGLTKVSLSDSRKHPTICMPYGQEVPLIHASAGMRRIIALAYLLVWTWHEHLEACNLRGESPAKEVIFLIDEIEAHLHPQWQRRIVPALLDVMKEIAGHGRTPIQLITATHSPLVIASTEPRFDEARDAVWELDLRDGTVELNQYPWTRRGDANAWLTSSVFDLKEPRSLEAEAAITAALDLLREEGPRPQDINRVSKLLSAALSDTDRFWVRWSQWEHERKDSRKPREDRE